MSEIDRHIDFADAAGLELQAIMMSPEAMKDFARNGRDVSSGYYRGVKIEEHDEWSWGWMLRIKGGGFVSIPTNKGNGA